MPEIFTTGDQKHPLNFKRLEGEHRETSALVHTPTAAAQTYLRLGEPDRAAQNMKRIGMSEVFAEALVDATAIQEPDFRLVVRFETRFLSGNPEGGGERVHENFRLITSDLDPR
ncbi:hypothetical protein ACFL2C_01225 [Patescibacteria group bacterium]